MAQDLVSPSLYPTAADLALLSGANVFPNHVARVSRISAALPVSARYRFVAASTSPDNNQSQLVVVPGTSPASGKWVRSDPVVDLVMPVTFATADAAQLLLVPAELTLIPAFAGILLEVTTIWAGGIAAALGLSLVTPSIARNKGALAGGVAGLAGFTSVCFFQMLLGSQFAAGIAQAPVLCPASQVQFDRFGTFFTSGAGNFHMPCFNTFTSITPVSPP